MQIQYIFSHREKGILSISITAAGRKESKESGDLSPAPPATCSADTQAGGEGPRLASNSLSLQQTARCSTYRPSQENVSGSGRCLCRAVCRAVGRPSPASLPRGEDAAPSRGTAAFMRRAPRARLRCRARSTPLCRCPPGGSQTISSASTWPKLPAAVLRRKFSSLEKPAASPSARTASRRESPQQRHPPG